MEIAYNEEVRTRLMTGINKLAGQVRVTVGPKGKNIAMHQKANLRNADYSDPVMDGAHVLVINDGVTIARSITLADPYENMGARLLKEAAMKTNEEAGDGTSTTIILAQSILKEAYQNVAAGANPVVIRRGLQKAGEAVVEALKTYAISVESEKEIGQVATISCQDQELGEMIGKALHTVGTEGVVTIEESKKMETSLRIEEGIVIDRGFSSPAMATDERHTMAELHDPYILFCDTKITDPQELLPVLIAAAEDERSCLIISDGVEGQAMGLIMTNLREGDMDIVCVSAPLYGEGRRWRMEDMAVQTGGIYVTKEMGLELRQVTREMLGTATYVRITGEQTVIRGGGGNPKAILDRVHMIRHLIEHTDYEFNRERYQDRLARFVSGIARIDVGGVTEPEMWERKMRVEDAVQAAKAALEEGIVPGGGITLLKLAERLERLAEDYEGDAKVGIRIAAKALREPSRQIAVNAGLDGSVILGHLMEASDGIGYDVEKNEFINMIEAGVVDPVKVIRLAVESAFSLSGTVLTIEAGVVAGNKKVDTM